MSTYPSKDIERDAAAVAAAGAAGAAAVGEAGVDCARAAGDEEASAHRDAWARRSRVPRARVESVLEKSPADDAGFEPGCFVTSVDGHPVRDLIDWRWLTADDVVTLGYIDLDGDAGEVVLERDAGEEWGFEFDGVIFDAVKQCRNACTFCFMRQLPHGMRPSLSLRDDDFRLSFLSGTFVTFTNLTPEDEARIIEQRISPLCMSLHAVRPSVRRRLIGKHAQHGIDVLERLLSAGIEFHTQIVLVPGENDGDVLAETLAWAYARPSIVNVGIVPLGFTKHQGCFEHSFNDPPASRAVLDLIVPIQKRALAERGTPWVFAADEFYRNAYGEKLLEKLPPASHYGDFSLFEDGIGIIRTYVDDWEASCKAGEAAACARALRAAGLRARFVVGGAMQPFLGQLVVASPLAEALEPLVVKNDFFGGNVDVTGLLCGCDIARAVAACDGGGLFCIPNVVFNDNGVTLDDMSLEDMQKAAGMPLHVVSCNPSGFLPEITALAEARVHDAAGGARGR